MHSIADTPPAAGPAPDAAAAALIAVVAEKTGYPAEVLELDMRLDDDLGIDSIKRVEILSALQEAYPGLPALPPDQLGSFRTLGAIAEFLRGASPAASGGADAIPAGAPTVCVAPLREPSLTPPLQGEEMGRVQPLSFPPLRTGGSGGFFGSRP